MLAELGTFVLVFFGPIIWRWSRKKKGTEDISKGKKAEQEKSNVKRPSVDHQSLPSEDAIKDPEKIAPKKIENTSIRPSVVELTGLNVN